MALQRAVQAPAADIVLIAVAGYLGQRGTGPADGETVMLAAGLAERLGARGGAVQGPHVVDLTAGEHAAIGAWQRAALHSAHLADAAAALRRRGAFPLALLGDCTGALGMLAGLRRAGARRPGMVWLDAHADFTTPETTRSGLLDRMSVAIAAGLCLDRLRRQAGLEPSLDTRRIVLVAVRDTDDLEQELIEEHRLAAVRTADLRSGCRRLREALGRLAELCDAVYVHIDLDVLDPAGAPPLALPVPSVPPIDELAAAVGVCLASPVVAALGVVVRPAAGDDGRAPAHVLKVLDAVATGRLAPG